MLTIEVLREYLNYNPHTGVFTWIKRSYGSPKIGTKAGSVHRDGYRCIFIRGRTYTVGQLAWFYMKGVWPVAEVDHKNRDNTDDPWENLREATPQQNSVNRRKRSDSKQPYKGVQKRGRRWRAVISVNGRRRTIGRFDTPEEASAAYKAKLTELYGEFAHAGT